jgi:chromosomal replication initiator protein
MADWDFRVFWQEALKQIKEYFHAQGKDQEYALWFGHLNYLSADEKAVVVSVESSFFRDQLISRGYVTMLQNKIKELLGQEPEISFQIEVREQKPAQKSKAAAQSDSAEAKKEPEAKKKHPLLREEYTFESFVPGEDNAFPYNAALAVSKNPGRTYNPLLLYGGVGLGKTHLMQAVGNAVYQNTGGKIIYTTAENFTNEFTDSIRTKTEPKFTSKYRNADVLLLDDIHFLQGKRAVQEQVYYTFDTLYNSYKQLIFICDRHISELKDMNERLVSRFERGLNVNFLPPNYETRYAILEKKLEIIGKTLSKDVIDLIAKNVETNVRDLESSLTKLLAYEDLIKETITVEIAQEQLRDTFSSPIAENITIENIQKIVANYFNISFSDIKGKKRTKSVALPRHIAFYIAHKLTEYSFTELGFEFGGKHHTSVMYACQQIENSIQHDSSLNETIQLLERRIKDKKI